MPIVTLELLKEHVYTQFTLCCITFMTQHIAVSTINVIKAGVTEYVIKYDMVPITP